MARYIRDIVLNKPENFVNFMLNDYAKKNGFAPSEWKGEPAFRAGDPMLEGYKYMKWNYENGSLHLEAWMQGSFGGEMDLNGFVAALQKKPFRESLEQLFVLLQQDVEIPAEQMAAEGENATPQPIMVQTVDNSKAATQGMVFGIISIVAALIIPLVGIIFAVLGINRSRLGSGSNKASQANAGKVLSIIGAVLSAAIWVLNIIINSAVLAFM